MDARWLPMEQDLERKLKETIGDLKCPKDFQCCTQGLEKLCQAEDIGMETFLKCLEEHPLDCIFAFPFGDSYFCSCPLRVHIAKKLKK